MTWVIGAAYDRIHNTHTDTISADHMPEYSPTWCANVVSPAAPPNFLLQIAPSSSRPDISKGGARGERKLLEKENILRSISSNPLPVNNPGGTILPTCTSCHPLASFLRENAVETI